MPYDFVLNRSMSVEGNQQFLFSWKLESFHYLFQHYDVVIKSPIFRVEALEGSEWSLNLLMVTKKDGLICQLQRHGCCKTLEKIPFCYQYELTDSTGFVLKFSDTLSDSFGKGGCSNPYTLVPFQDLKLIGDVCYLRCRLRRRLNTTTPIASRCCPPVSYEAETEFSYAGNTLDCFFLEFEDLNKLSTVRRVETLNLKIEITFRYVNDELQIELFSQVEDNTFNGVFCYLRLTDEKLVFSKEKNDKFEFTSTSKLWKFPSFIKKKDLEDAKCFLDKQIQILIFIEDTYQSRISTNNDCKDDSRDIKNSEYKDHPDCLLHLQQDLRNMFIDKTYADVKLRVDEEIFLAHRCVLAARSPVLGAMFDQDMLENKASIIDIHDVESKLVKLFLKYLYTGSLDDIDEGIALNLLILADKYQVSSLTEKCSTFLKSVLSFGNVLNVLKVADNLNQEQFKLFAIEYIVENSKKVLSTPEWSQWMKINPTLTTEIFLKLSKRFDSAP